MRIANLSNASLSSRESELLSLNDRWVLASQVLEAIAQLGPPQNLDEVAIIRIIETSISPFNELVSPPGLVKFKEVHLSAVWQRDDRAVALAWICTSHTVVFQAN